MFKYDDTNIFAKIIRGQLPSDKVLETEHALAFHDINPHAPIHVLVIPKGPYVSMDDFTVNASAEEIAGLWRAVGEAARLLDLVEVGIGLCRIIAPTLIRKSFTSTSIFWVVGLWGRCSKVATSRRMELGIGLPEIS